MTWNLTKRGIPDPATGDPGDVLTVQGDDTVDWDAPTGGGSPTGSAGGALDGSYPNPGLAAGVAGAGLAESSDVLAVNVDDSTIEINTDALRVKALGITDSHVATANKDGTTSTPSLRTLGTGAAQAAAGNDSRFTDSRAPTGAAGGVLSGTYPNPGFAADMATQAELDAAIATTQPLDSDLTAIAALTTTSYGRALLALADAAALQTAAALVPGTNVEAHDTDLTTIAAISPTNDDVIQRKAGAWTNRSMAQLIADLAALGTTFQPLDSDLTAVAALTTTTFGRSLLTLADAAAALASIGAAPSARVLTAGAALTGGGDLSSDRTFDVAVDGSTIEVSSDALRVKALGITDSHVAAANKDGASGTASMRTLGTGAAQAAAGNDSRFTNLGFVMVGTG